MKLFLTFFYLTFCVSQIFSQKNNPNIYVYNNNLDTIFLSKTSFDGFHSSQLSVFDTIQIDGIGAKEVVLSRSFDGTINKHGGTFDIDENLKYHKYEIWNLDTKTLLFQARSFYSHHYNRFIAQGGIYRDNGSFFYSYDFKINEKGEINLSKLIQEEGTSPDSEMGEYHYKEGSYIKIE